MQSTAEARHCRNWSEATLAALLKGEVWGQQAQVAGIEAALGQGDDKLAKRMAQMSARSREATSCCMDTARVVGAGNFLSPAEPAAEDYAGRPSRATGLEEDSSRHLLKGGTDLCENTVGVPQWNHSKTIRVQHLSKQRRRHKNQEQTSQHGYFLCAQCGEEDLGVGTSRAFHRCQSPSDRS